MLLYRLGKREHARKLDGVGARDHPGRWNSLGTAMVYCSDDPATAILEVLVHMDRARRGLVMTTLELPDDAPVLMPAVRDLPKAWGRRMYDERVRAFGDAFVLDGGHLAVRVPSAVTPGAFNYLLNPAHPDMRHVRVADVRPFVFDQRLFKRRRKAGGR